MPENQRGEPICHEPVSWTVGTLAVYSEALRKADEKFQEERDRRYSSEDALRERALAIKERADERALGLAREIQTYKDEKANELREQIASERGLYVTKDELTSAVRELTVTIKPLVEDQARGVGSRHTLGQTLTIGVAALASVAAVVIAISTALH